MSRLHRSNAGRVRAPAVALAVVIIAGCIAGGANAQLPTSQLPSAGRDAVEDVVPQALPETVDDAVRNSPAAPVRQGVQDALQGATGSTGSAPSGGGGSTGSTASGGSGSTGSGTGAGSTGRRATGSSPTANSGDSGSRAGSPSRARARRAAAARAARARRAARREAGDKQGIARAASRTEQGGVGRRLKDIVEVVPGWMQAALALLGALALVLGGRMLFERRRARRFERDRDRLQQNVGVLQSALLPEVPEQIGTLVTSVSYRPAEGLAAGGDFYDVFELPGGRAAIIIGDVSGHGQEALIKTASVRHSLGAYLRAGMEPRRALAAAGEHLPVGDDGHFTTVVMGVYDPAAATLTYSSAGHPPPIVSGTGAHEPVTAAASPPLGVGVPTGLRQTTVSMLPGDTACFFTDGLLEARCDGGLLGRERLAWLAATLPPDDSAAALIGRVRSEADTIGDDLAVCIIRATAGSRAPRPRMEELLVGPSELDLERAERLMEDCEVQAPDAAAARQELIAAGTALLRVTVATPPLVVVEPLGEAAGSLLPA